MGILSKFSIAAANFDFEVKKIFRSLFEVATIAAAGSSNTDATALTAGKNLVTAADGTKGVILPRSEPEMAVTVVNTVSTSDLKVYPDASGQINALTATTGAFTIPGGQEATFHCDVGLHWYVSTGSGASAAELEVLNGATSTNATTGKAAILGTGGAVQFGGAVTAVGSFIIGSADMSEADLELLDSITAGTSQPSKALTTDAAESLVWATTDATASETCTLTITDTRTGAGATGWAAKFDLESNVALGSYANGVYGIINFGASGKCTGLAAGVVGEITMSAGTVDGTYAAIEAEFNVPSGASLGTNSSLMYLSVNGADASTFDTSGYLFTLAGVTAGTSKMLMNVGTATALADFTKGLRVKVAGVDYVVPLITAAEFAS